MKIPRVNGNKYIPGIQSNRPRQYSNVATVASSLNVELNQASMVVNNDMKFNNKKKNESTTINVIPTSCRVTNVIFIIMVGLQIIWYDFSSFWWPQVINECHSKYDRCNDNWKSKSYFDCKIIVGGGINWLCYVNSLPPIWCHRVLFEVVWAKEPNSKQNCE